MEEVAYNVLFSFYTYQDTAVFYIVTIKIVILYKQHFELSLNLCNLHRIKWEVAR